MKIPEDITDFDAPIKPPKSWNRMPGDILVRIMFCSIGKCWRRDGATRVQQNLSSVVKNLNSTQRFGNLHD